jgi:3-oxoacyl-[acyl-carrier-protein] synthase-1
MNRSVHIVAVAARTPVGITAEAAAAAVRARISRVQEHPFMVESRGERVYCGYDGRLAPTLLGASRIAALAQAALRELAGKLTARHPYSAAIPLLLATPELRPGFTQDDARRVQRTLIAQPFSCSGKRPALSLRQSSKYKTQFPGVPILAVGP